MHDPGVLTRMPRRLDGIVALGLLAASTACMSELDPGPARGASNACTPGPSEAPVRRLTTREYMNTVSDLFGGLAVPTQPFPPPQPVGFFENNAVSLPPTALLVESEVDASDAIATLAVAERARWLSCTTSDAACAETAVRELLPRAYRRPLTADEEARALDFVRANLAEVSFDLTLHDLVQAALLSPQFLYHMELERDREPEGLVALDDYELASRLSYLIWQSMPDDALFDAAEAGLLVGSSESETSELLAQAERMLADPRAHDTVEDFHRQWLNLDALSRVALDAAAFPELDAGLRESYRGSLEAYLDWAFWEEQSIDRMLDADRVYVDARLASLLDLPTPTAGFAPVSDPDRRGLLTQPGLLASTSHGSGHAPILRGVTVLRRVLCYDIPPPPPSIPGLENVPAGEARTTREHIENSHSGNPACASCHTRIDGAGFVFEHYDALGRHRTTENGLPVDARGNVPVGDLEGTDVSDALELADVVAGSRELRYCYANQWYRFAFGHLPERSADACEVTTLANALGRAGGDPRALVLAIVESTSFRNRPAIVTSE